MPIVPIGVVKANAISLCLPGMGLNARHLNIGRNSFGDLLCLHPDVGHRGYLPELARRQRSDREQARLRLSDAFEDLRLAVHHNAESELVGAYQALRLHFAQQRRMTYPRPLHAGAVYNPIDLQRLDVLAAAPTITKSSILAISLDRSKKPRVDDDGSVTDERIKSREHGRRYPVTMNIPPRQSVPQEASALPRCQFLP